MAMIVSGCAMQIIPPSDFGERADVISWVAENIEYLPDDESLEGKQYWQTPQETLDRRTGDCEDFVVLDVALLHDIGIESFAVMISSEDGDHHVILKVGNDFYAAQTGMMRGEPERIDAMYSFEQLNFIVLFGGIAE